MNQQPDPNQFTAMNLLHEQTAEKVRQGVQLLANAGAQFDEFGRSKEAAIIGELYSRKAENILGAYVGPMSIKLKHPGFHRRLHRTRYKQVSRLPESALRFIAQSPTLPCGACSPQSDQPGKPADNGPNPDEAQGS
ncbi:MAG TPA: hypothetical protein VIF37_20575 [Methylobacter sp.]|jgi:hypothetical protein